jgi:NDP-hexose-3-ketoreductase
MISLKQVKRIHIASRKGFSGDGIPIVKRGRMFNEYESALTTCSPCLCYISLPNSMHAEWAYHALENGFHVILDKPAVTKKSDAVALTDLAQHRGLCISEANVWPYHPLAQIVCNTIRTNGSLPQAAVAIFTSPPLDPGNFRYNPIYGAGVLWDRGPYAVSCGRILYNDVPAKVFCEIVAVAGRVDISFCATMIYPNGSILTGFFSLGTEYRNTLSVIGEFYSCDADRIFTPPADFEGAVIITKKNAKEVIPVQKYDIFAGYLEDVISCIHKGKVNHFGKILLEDSCVLDDLRNAAINKTYIRNHFK